jgi:hypothetical protein
MAALVADDGISRIPLRARNGQVRAYALVDADMEPILSAHPWHLSRLGYVIRTVPADNGKQKVISIHRQITRAPDGLAGCRKIG